VIEVGLHAYLEYTSSSERAGPHDLALSGFRRARTLSGLDEFLIHNSPYRCG